MAERVELPEGQDSFKLNEVCKLANVQPYMLRFWGTEFDQLEAGRSGTGQRLYTRDQVELILEIRHLLFEEGLTIAGARKRIAALQEEGAVAPAAKSSTRKSRSKTSSAARKVVPTTPDVGDVPVVDSDEVDKQAAERVQPLVAALRNVRQELSEIVAELGSDSA
jgi:DNA-binding transcriptional MerR regulator